MKPFKIRGAANFRDRYGIVCRSFEECKSKGCKKLGIGQEELKHVKLQDGTIVDTEEYFHTLDKHTVLIFETYSDTPGSTADTLFNMLSDLRMDREVAGPLLAKARKIPNGSLKKAIVTIIAQLDHGNVKAELRSEDPDWFEKLPDKRVQSKSKVMESSAMNRVRSYWYEAKKILQSSELTATQRRVAEGVQRDWEQKLKNEKMFRHYFSRTNRRDYTLCCSYGWFSCEGEYTLDSCPHDHHIINPYQSSELRAVFSQWNLDHQIEKARTVLPRVSDLLASNASNVNWDYFFDLMFTRANLRLVHIACHNKQEHTTATIDESRVLL